MLPQTVPQMRYHEGNGSRLTASVGQECLIQSRRQQCSYMISLRVYSNRLAEMLQNVSVDSRAMQSVTTPRPYGTRFPRRETRTSVMIQPFTTAS